MPAPTPKSGACSCGQVVFDLTGRKKNEVLNCSWCGKKFKYLGDDRIEPLTADDIKFLETGKSMRPKQPQKRSGPPGGVWPMVIFIVAGNALAFGALALLLPKGEDGLRHTLWESDFTIPGRAIWPDLSALAVGHILGFCCWAIFVYYLHQKEKAARA